MLTIHNEEIVVKERQRTHFDEAKIAELAESFLTNGIIHPPATRQDTASGPQILAAGERRLRAMQKIIATGRQIRHGDQVAPPGHIFYSPLGVMSEEDAYVAELHENIIREDLQWQERAEAEARLLNLRSREAAAAGRAQPTMQAIATEVLQRKTGTEAKAQGAQVTATATRVMLAKHLADPEVAKAKTEAEAVKVVRRKLEAERITALAQEHEQKHRSSCPHTLLVGDMREQLATLPDASVDVLLTDPPYGIGADTFGEQSGTGHNYQDDEQYFLDLINVLAEESFRIAKDQAHAYVFCDPRGYANLEAAFTLAGWSCWHVPLIWDKGNGMLPRPEHGPRRTYEMIMYAIKGDKRVRTVKPDVLRYGQVKKLQHGAQKPVDLYVDLLSRSAVPGNTVFDPFAGSGTIFPAANQAHCIAIGVELDPHNANICRTRMMGEEETIGGLEELENENV